jgi:ribosome-associated protein
MQEPVPQLSEPADLARLAAETLSDRLATNIVLIDLSRQSGFADYFVIATGDNERHMRALREAVETALTTAGHEPLHVEGTADSGWVLMDYGSFLVHIFSPELRSYYRLEELWGKSAAVAHFA